MEMALLAPLLISLLIAVTDFGTALLSQAQIARAVARSAEYATLAGQNSVATATIITNARTIAGAVASPFVGTPIVTAVVNQGVALPSKCCPDSAGLHCTARTSTCADGSTPGVYIKVQAQYPFLPLFSVDTYLTGATLSDSIVAPLQ